MIEEPLKVQGTVYIYSGNKEKLLHTFPNLFLTAGQHLLIDCLMEKYSYLSIGTGSKPVSMVDERLDREVYRKEITSISRSDNKILIDFFFGLEETNFQWKEVGLFTGGSLGEANSGVLFNRALVNVLKTVSETITLTWEIKFV